MNVLVTGGAGFMGGHVTRALLSSGDDVAVLDNLSTGARANLDPRCEFLPGDVRDSDRVSAVMQGRDAVVHLAAYTSVPESFREADLCFEVNVEGTLNVLDAAVRAGVPKVVFASSSAVYADEPDGPKLETMCPGPCSPYAVSKLEGEHLLAWFRRRRGLHTTALRFFNVYGPRQDASSDYAAVIPIFIERALAGETLTIYGNGQQTRDFIYAQDVADAVLASLRSPYCGVLNVGTGRAVRILDLAEQVLSLTGSKGGYVFADRRPGDAASSTADISAIVRDLEWTPGIGLEQGLSQTLRWFRGQNGSGEGHGRA